MKLLNFLKKETPTKQSEPPIPDEEKKYYRPDDYYTDTVPTTVVGADGTCVRRKVVTFEDRKKISYPSKSGLYVAEILLLEYCSYGTYPHPKTGYPGFWWFTYGIRNVGNALKSLEDRGYIQWASARNQIPQMTVPQLKEIASKLDIKISGKKSNIVKSILDNATDSEIDSVIGEKKYELTEKGSEELRDNGYVPYMHKCKYTTIEKPLSGYEFNVWSINRIIGESKARNWHDIVAEELEKISNNNK
ncbi:SAP domain-containing protein [Butyricicoccus sp.]|uniref:SAP domain-containing protein n=1 Tax=Butyricicoccus sp. TaxID=2049021 RepID=UPI003F149D92